ncbi:preprotein translocase subunit SecE [bacterium]|nr:preprotein translocase subunit SecE [bacterium]
MLAKIRDFFQGVVRETKQIQWPKREVVVYNAVIVIIAILISILVVAGIDYVLAKLINWYVALK